MSRQLPSQLVSLIHHIALNEAGWWNKAIQNFIISSVWLNTTPSTIKSISEDLQNNFGISLDIEILKSNIQTLCTQNVLFSFSNGQYKLSETSRKNFENDLKKHENLIESVKQFFTEQIKINCPDLMKNDCWNEFNNQLLIPIINQLGAKTYELISGHTTTIEQTPIFQNYIESFDEKMRSDIKKVIIAFFDANNSDNRDYILRIINSFFFLEAGNLSSDSLQKINKIQNKDIEFDLFIDTNFLFSIMNLHDNPFNEAAISLKKLIDTIKSKVKVKFYVTAKTLEEASGVLEFQKNKLKGISLKRNIIEAANNYDFSGFEKKYFEEIQKSDKSISPDDYFEPYLNNILILVRNHGVEFYNENMDKYSIEQKVIDDIMGSIEHEKNFLKPKTYEQWKHDIILWNFVKDKRPNYIESHIDAKYWIVTIDFRFLGFDRYKGKGNNSELNIICMHPASLIQMLQFWLPRSKEFEEAILSNIRTPLFYTEFDNDSELMANLILKRLSRFEDIEDLSVETITAVLQNEVLKNKLKSNPDVEEQINLIKDAIIEENNKIQNELKKSKLQKNALNSLLSDKDKEIKELKDSINTFKEDSLKQKLSFEERIAKIENENEAKEKFNNEHIKWEADKNEFQNKKWDEYKKPRWFFIYFLTIGIILLILLCIFIYSVNNDYLKYSPIIGILITLILSFFNRDKIICSFQLIFKLNKIKGKKFKDYFREFPNKEPKFEDFLNK